MPSTRPVPAFGHLGGEVVGGEGAEEVKNTVRALEADGERVGPSGSVRASCRT
jgi:hypothetical protein